MLVSFSRLPTDLRPPLLRPPLLRNFHKIAILCTKRNQGRMKVGSEGKAEQPDSLRRYNPKH